MDNIEMDDATIRIDGRKNVLEQAITRQNFTPNGVPTFVRKWMGWQDFMLTN